MAEARFPIYDVAYGTLSNANLRATVAIEPEKDRQSIEKDIQSMLEDQVNAFFLNMNPQIYKIRDTKYLSDRIGVMSNSLLDINRSPSAV